VSDAHGGVGSGGVKVSIEGASKADIECSDSGCDDGQCCVNYYPSAPGLYVVNVLFADQPVQGTSHTYTGWPKKCKPQSFVHIFVKY